jgi:hypothetical protein
LIGEALDIGDGGVAFATTASYQRHQGDQSKDKRRTKHRSQRRITSLCHQPTAVAGRFRVSLAG